MIIIKLNNNLYLIIKSPSIELIELIVDVVVDERFVLFCLQKV